MTSSMTSSAPRSRVSSRSAVMNPSFGGMHPMLPTTGSRMTAAMRSGCASKSARTESASLYVADSVVPAHSAGTPGESGVPSVSAPEPAEDRSASEWPW